MGRQYIDLTGETFGKLTVLGFHSSKKGHTFWTCQCACGNKVVLRKDGLTRAKDAVKSCGCNRGKKGEA